MKWDIVSYVGVGPLRFGASRDQIRLVLQQPWDAFKRTPSDITETDGFFQSSLFVYYDPDYRCEAIELSAPFDPSFDGFSLIGKPFSEILDWTKTRDSEVVIRRAGLMSPKFGFRVYAPSCAKNPADPVQSVIVFQRGYGQPKPAAG